MSLRERLDTLSRGELAGLIVVLVATLAGVGFWYSRSLPRAIQVAETPAPSVAAPASPPASGAALASGSASVSTAAQLLVDVAGGVRKPGTCQFDPGARVVTAVPRAGEVLGCTARGMRVLGRAAGVGRSARLDAGLAPARLARRRHRGARGGLGRGPPCADD